MRIGFSNTMWAAVAALSLAGLAPAAAASESDELRAEVAALKQRLDQMESGAGARSVPAWVNRISWSGDLRLRNDLLHQQYAPDRNRLRLRARAGLEAKVNDTVRTVFALTTAEGGDPRSSNQTLTGENSRKPIQLDLGYAEWAPGPDWKLTVGKMRFPLIRPGQTTLIDADVNPEGLAAIWTPGEFFASALYNLLEERGGAAESTLLAGQFAWRPQLGGGKLVVGTGYYAYRGVRGRNPFHAGAPNGNTTTTDVAVCVDVTPCLLNDYDVLQLFGEWSQRLAGRPLSLYVDLDRNTAADNNLDSAWSAGFVWGKAAEPMSWEVGFSWHDIEKDAVYGQLFESDYASGTTDNHGGVLRAGFAPARNWVINASWCFGETGVDVPVTIPGVGAVPARNVRRLMLDLNFRY